MIRLLKFRFGLMLSRLMFAIEGIAPFRAWHVENNESRGHWTPWSALRDAKDWKLEVENYWGEYCGRFNVTFLGLVIASYE